VPLQKGGTRCISGGERGKLKGGEGPLLHIRSKDGHRILKRGRGGGGERVGRDGLKKKGENKWKRMLNSLPEGGSRARRASERRLGKGVKGVIPRKDEPEHQGEKSSISSKEYHTNKAKSPQKN